MNPPPFQPPPDIDYQPPQPKKGLSSGAKWGIGCGSGCLVALLIGGVISYFIWMKARELKDALLDEYTSEIPIAFEAPDAEQSTIDALVTRYDQFSEAMISGKDSPPLVLNSEEINLLLYHHPDWNEAAGHTAVEIEGDQLTGQISLPLGDLMPLLAGRYLNGKATIRLLLVDGNLEGYIDGIEVAEKAAPPEFISEMQKENLFEGFHSDPELRKMIESLESLEIKDGQLIIVPKPAAERQTPTESPPGDESIKPIPPAEKPVPVEA